MMAPSDASLPRLRAASQIAVQLLAVMVLALPGSPVFAKKEPPPVDADGLHLLEGTKVRIAYARPGATLQKYSRVKLLDCFIQFEDGWAKEYNLDQVGIQGRVADKDVEAMKDRLSQEFRTVFQKELTDAGYPVVDDTGTDVLLLRPAIVNLQVTAPDLMRAGRSTVWVSSAGSMTLYLEMYDSASSELIARVIDPRADPDATSERASRVTNKAAADRIIRRWAQQLISHMDEVKSAGR